MAVAVGFTHSGVFRATAYCQTGRTASGTIAGPGTVAVDPSVLRLGARLWVQGYGPGRALDTGGAIRGRRIDLWMGSCAQALRWGVRWVRVRW